MSIRRTWQQKRADAARKQAALERQNLQSSVTRMGLALVGAASIGALSALNRLVHDRSLGASALALAFRMLRVSRPYTSAQSARAYMWKQARINDQPYVLPRDVRLTCSTRWSSVNGYQVLILDPPTHDSANTTADNLQPSVILYLHGGAFVHQLRPAALAMADRIAAATDCTTVIPLYPLAPLHDYRDAYAIIEQLYDRLIANVGAEHIVLMGDSAGGGIAAGLCEVMAQTGRPQPARLVLISPHVDSTLSNTAIRAIAPYDPLLDTNGLHVILRAWAGSASLRDPHISPLYGDVSHFPPTLITTGTHEIIHADIMRFAEKLEHAGIANDLIVGTNLMHDYPLMPTKEARTTVTQIINWIRS